MRSTFNILLLVTLLLVYLFPTAGIGRYSCHCDHSSQITLLGISSQCSCTHSGVVEDPGHCCPCCGEHLITLSIKKDDCCSVRFYFLDTDQDNSSGNHVVILLPAIHDFFISQPELTAPSLKQERIKTFQSVFRLFRYGIYNINHQLLI
ncbi:MAG: hypothetical protein PHP30_04380 [Bacteroidales bacterium]|nr:hypothetical protein [Bacteroidales bacterium]MDD3989317.1 hypothetical protein [Bacteroidales bacterium]MDD4638567.1 hypothetical protein [Bacteroidales bacterium]